MWKRIREKNRFCIFPSNPQRTNIPKSAGSFQFSSSAKSSFLQDDGPNFYHQGLNCKIFPSEKSCSIMIIILISGTSILTGQIGKKKFLRKSTTCFIKFIALIFSSKCYSTSFSGRRVYLIIVFVCQAHVGNMIDRECQKPLKILFFLPEAICLIFSIKM